MNRLRTKILLLCVGVVLLTSVVILTSFWINTSRFTGEQVDQTIEAATRTFSQLLETRETQLITSAELLTADFGFKQAVATQDAPTINSALFNHSARVDADLMFLTDLRGDLKATTHPELQPGESFPHPELIRSAADDGGAVSFVRVADDLYQIVILPVRAPRPIAFAGVGFKLDEQIAAELKTLTNLEVTFDINGKHGKHLISTLPDAQLKAALNAAPVVSEYFGLPFITDQQFVSRKTALTGAEPDLGDAILSANLAATTRGYDALRNSIAIISVVILLLSLLGSLILARNLVDPLNRLVTIALEMARGNYDKLLEGRSTTTEINLLFSAFTSMASDIRDREKRIRFQAEHDPLTGLLNRNTLLEKLSARLEKKPGAQLLVAVNIRGFRNINDSFGPQLGDLCLQTIAERLESFDAIDALHCRLGADEYISVLPLQSADSSPDIIEHLREVLEQKLKIQDITLNLQFTIGYALYPDNGERAQSLLRRATIAVDKARQTTQAIHAYVNGEDESHLKSLAIMNDLKSAIAGDDGQLYMCYQPKMHLERQSIEKMEALIRWKHPVDGFVSPELFIALAEKSTLITELTDWVIERVIKDCVGWQDRYPSLQVAINISSKDLEREELLPNVRTLLQKYALTPEHLCFEMTERDMMADPDHAIELMSRFTREGFDLSVDDYGIGHSSLSKLKQMPVTEIKIDKSFVQNLETSESDRIIVKSTIDLGHSFGLGVIAEGVETEAASGLLRDMGCDYIQGYFLSRPLEVSQIDQFMEPYAS
ncbi:MAG: EAL domain-containing protein [Pseudomonadales bacterium]|nr:EAL domain-containing protein [Pseudomonadales bacterium]